MKLIICFASWEDRFHLSFQNHGNALDQRILCIQSTEYEDWTFDNVLLAFGEDRCGEYSVLKIVHRKPETWWMVIEERVRAELENCHDIEIHYSTMPRDVLWCLLSILENSRLAANLIYYSPNAYAEVLTYDPSEPIFVFRHSGIVDPLKKTAVLVQVGFDLIRSVQLYVSLEPERFILLVQTGEQYFNLVKNAEIHEQWRADVKEGKVEMLEIDVFDIDNGSDQMTAITSTLSNDYNIVLASNGPKPGAVGIYRTWKETENCSLVYVPSRGYRREYSYGIGNLVESRWNPTIRS